jgi:hypothetical protein
MKVLILFLFYYLYFINNVAYRYLSDAKQKYLCNSAQLKLFFTFLDVYSVKIFIDSVGLKSIEMTCKLIRN